MAKVDISFQYNKKTHYCSAELISISHCSHFSCIENKYIEDKHGAVLHIQTTDLLEAHDKIVCNILENKDVHVDVHLPPPWGPRWSVYKILTHACYGSYYDCTLGRVS